MAVVQRRTRLVNPAWKRRRGARKMSAKQIRFFGTKAQKAGLKRRRSGSHRARSVPKANPKRRSRPRAAPKKKHRRRRSNVSEIITASLAGLAGNPARKSGKKRRSPMARSKKRKAGRRRASNPHKHRRSMSRNPVARAPRRRSRRRVIRRAHRNPGVGRVGGLLMSGVYVVGGAVGTRMLTQALLGVRNAGVFGYVGNALSAFGLSWGVKKFVRNPQAANMVLLGGFTALAIRLLQDYTPLGQFVQANLAGMGIRGDTGMGLLLNNSFSSPMIYDQGGAVMPSAWRAMIPAPAAAVSGLGRSTYRSSTYA